MSGTPEIDSSTHRSLAVDLFNQTWDLIDRTDRTPDDDLEMIHRAHASRWHWGKVGAAEQFSIGEWQVSRVYAILGHGAASLYHGQECLRYAEEPEQDLWLAGYTHEAIARAYAVLGDNSQAVEHVSKARAIAESLADQETAKMILDDLATISLV